MKAESPVQDIDYLVSLYPSRNKEGRTVLARWNVNRARQVNRITLYLGRIWQEPLPDTTVGEYGTWDWDIFMQELIRTILVETICLERAGQGSPIKNRCKPFRDTYSGMWPYTYSCKMMFLADRLLKMDAGWLCP